MSITGSNNPFACEPVVFANANAIVSLGTITRDGNEFTFSVGFVWKINGVTYQNTAPVVLTIAEASTGFQRIDNALLNTSNTIELQQGLESETIALRPVAPDTNIILTSWNISGDAIGDTETPILGTQFKKKTESLGFSDPYLSGTNAVIQLRPEGNSRYAFSNPGLISIDGFGTSLISGNPNAEAPYDGKDLFIENTGTTPFTLKHDGAGTADAKFFFTDETDLIVPVGGKLWLKYGNPYCQLFFKNWSEVDLSTKLDKSTTPDSVYATDVAGSQVMKPITDFISPTQLLEDFYNKSAKAIIEWVPYISIWGNAIAPTATGTADNVAPLWTGTYFQAQFRRRYASAVTAGSSTSFRDSSFRHTAIGEGFVSIQIFGNEDAVNVAQARSACGLIGANGEMGNVNPSTAVKFIGVANDSGQANLHFNVSSLASLNHNIDLGSSFPANTNSTDFYLLIMINDKGVSNLKWRVVNLHSGADTGYSTITTGLPASTMGLSPQVWRNNGSTALAVKNSIMLYRLLKM